MKSQYRNGAPDLDKSTIDYEAIQEPGHGHSVAGWTAVATATLGVILVTLGVVVGPFTLVWVGAAVIVVAIILAPVLHKAGLGPKPHLKTLSK